MVNIEVDPKLLEPLVPRGTELDTWEGRHYVSVVGFRFLRTRVLGIAVPFHTNFDELNLRFYVRRTVDGEVRRGVVFVREVVPKWAIAAVARWVYGENYISLPMKSDVRLDGGAGYAEYSWRLRGEWGRLRASCNGPSQPLVPASEAEFITEHYWGYCRQRDGGTMEYQVQHPPWRVWPEAKLSLAGDLRAIYGADFGDCLKQTPVSGLVAEGSPIVVHRGTRLPAY